MPLWVYIRALLVLCVQGLAHISQNAGQYPKVASGELRWNPARHREYPAAFVIQRGYRRCVTFASFVRCLDVFRMFRGSPDVYLALTCTTEDLGRLGVLVLPSAKVLNEELYPRFSARVVCKKLGLLWLTLLTCSRVFVFCILNDPELVPNGI